MTSKLKIYNAFILLIFLLIGVHQAAASPRKASRAQTATGRKAPQQFTGHRFALDVLRMAVALPQPNLQDRLRVLTSAVQVATPLDRSLAQRYAREGVRVEGDLVAAGEMPAASIMATGEIDCHTAQTFVDRVYPQSVQLAEQSLIGAVGACKSGTFDAIRNKADGALAKGIVAPRLMMALYQAAGEGSAWAQTSFEKLFSSLPNPEEAASRADAANFAAMYSTMTPTASKDVARDTGMKFLAWLTKMESSAERNLAARIAADAMTAVLGEEAMKEALARDVTAQQLLQQAKDGPHEIERPPEEQASVLEAMQNNGTDQSDRLRQLPATMRARQAAANGFASGTAGDKKSSANYFDIAFSAADESWSDRGNRDMAPLLQEVCEAAAQVDAVSALSRAQHLQDPTAQAIGMLAVARVVSSQQ